MGAYFAAHPLYGPLCPEGMGEMNQRLLEAIGVLKPWHLRLYATGAFEAATRATDWAFGPGYLIHFPVRKRFMDEQVREAAEAGCTQLLVLGAGLDSLALRWTDRLRCAELDHPATAGAKQAATRLIGLDDKLIQVAVDLGEKTVGEALKDTGWDASAPTVIIAEGLLMYLPEAAVESLFQGVAAAVGPGSRFVFSWLPEDDAGQVLLDPATRLFVKLGGEPMKWSTHRDRLGPLLERNGWTLQPAVDLRELLLAGTPLADEPLTQNEQFSVVHVCE
jgi:methyltransferase (TIGR00027 family)